LRNFGEKNGRKTHKYVIKTSTPGSGFYESAVVHMQIGVKYQKQKFEKVFFQAHALIRQYYLIIGACFIPQLGPLEVLLYY
jgi:hypothetical protein